LKVDFPLVCPFLDTRCFAISVDGPCSKRWDSKGGDWPDRICGRPYDD
jgi:hypothetical protein